MVVFYKAGVLQCRFAIVECQWERIWQRSSVSPAHSDTFGFKYGKQNKTKLPVLYHWESSGAERQLQNKLEHSHILSVSLYNSVLDGSFKATLYGQKYSGVFSPFAMQTALMNTRMGSFYRAH